MPLSSIYRYSFFLLVSALICSCGLFESDPPFPVENKSEWKKYLQGEWRHTRSDTVFAGGRSISTDSSYYQLSFVGDSVRVLRKMVTGNSLVVGEATCVLEYNSPPKIDITSCVEGRKYQVWTQSTFNYEKGDTTKIKSGEMPEGSREAEGLAKEVSQAIPRFQTVSVDSLRVLYGNGGGFYLTRQ